MKSQAKLTSKGQITVPRSVRHALGVKDGDKIVFEMNGGDITVRSLRATSPFAKYRGIADMGVGKGMDGLIKSIREMRGRESDDE